MATERIEGPSDVAVVVEKRSRISVVWIFPLVAAVLGAWLLYNTIAQAGVPITITFETADGLEAGKTVIKFKDVRMGVIDSIMVSDDMKGVVVGAIIERHAERYLRETTRFWVVRPRITTQGISGLSTLLSGAYIALEPGGGTAAHVFQGLEKPPVLNVDAPGHEYVLHAAELGSLSVGSPVYFRGILVGEVLSHQLDADARGVSIVIFVNAPHHVLVWRETQFWNASGLDVTLGADGMSVQTASLEALLIGGISFETPLHVQKGTPAGDGTEFVLHRRREDIDPHFGRVWSYVAYFDGSVRGLSSGAPVELRGLRVGEVVHIGFESDRDTGAFRVPVTIAIEPERLADLSDEREPVSLAQGAEDTARKLIAAGLRARLETGSLLTGQLFVDLVLVPGSPENYVRGKSAHFEIPTLPNEGLAQIETAVNRVLAKIEALPLDRLVENAAAAAESLNRLVGSPELSATITNTSATVEAVQKLARDADAKIERLVAAVEAMLGPTVRSELAGALRELASAARSIRALTEYLERHPEALLQGKSGGK